MAYTDPYSPPQASLGSLTPSEQADLDSGALRYSGFWQRVGAYLIDFLIISPLLALDYIWGGETRMYQVYALVPAQMLSLFLYIYMVVKFGGTPGKLLLGMRIVKLTGSPVTVREAALRYAVLWLFTIVTAAMMINAALGMTDQEYTSLGYMARAVALSARAPGMLIVTSLMQLWMVGCLIAIIANRKRRTLNDFIAGTVVVRK